MKIVADDHIPFLREALRGQDATYLPGSSIGPADVRDADALIVRTRTRCDATLLATSRVRLVLTATIGTDHLDLPWLAARGIEWHNAPDCNARSVEQYVGSALSWLHLRRGLQLSGRVMSVVGVGHVGSLVASLALRLGMRVLLVDPPRAEREGAAGFTPYDEALRQADILTFHTPLLPTTRHLFDAGALAKLKPGATLINTSRGPVCDTQAILDGLASDRIAHAALDVHEGEPNANPELLRQADLTTPHIAGYSTDSKLRATTAVVAHLGLPWQPPTLPQPKEPVFQPPANADQLTAATEMLLHVYDIERDSRALKERPDTFEALRGNYPLQREIDSFCIGAGAPHAGYLRGFGIRVLGNGYKN